MATLTDNFDSYTDGDLNGQGSWSGSVEFDVQGTVVQAGAKAVAYLASSSNSISKDFTASTTGVQSIWGRVSDVTIDGRWSFRMASGASAIFYIKTNAGNVVYFDGATYTTLGAVSNNTWFQVECQFDASTDKARYRLNGGTWTAYASGTAVFTTLDRLYLVCDTATAGSSYWDTCADGSAPATTNSNFLAFM